MEHPKQKENYQKILDKLLEQLESQGKVLCTLQQLCAGISFPVF